MCILFIYLRQHLAQQLEEKETKAVETAGKDEDDWHNMVQMIDKWNKKVAVMRYFLYQV